ncbi:MAG: efflux RND transporter periplasmic adaptor subunit [Comamonadaceae bacterium]|nr:efflux RND transporter periplasmic adaptor subunit [Comamonadaceae bacterium]
MKPWLKWTLAVLLMALLGAGAQRTLSARSAKQAALAAQQQAQKTQVSIDLTAADVISLKVREVPQNIAISGDIKAVNTAFVKARVAGELQGLVLREGDAVKAGQILAHIDPTDSNARLSQARQQAQAARAQVDIAQRSFDNSRALVAQGFISNTALETSQANLAAAQANHAAAQSAADVAAKAVDDTQLRAPISGLISQRLAQTGERLAVEARVVEIVDLNRLELEAALSAEDAAKIRLGQSAQLRVDGMPHNLSARVVRINPSATAGSRAVRVYLAIEPDGALRQGLFAQGVVLAGSLNTLALPLTAVRTDKPQPYVQVIVQNLVQHVPVELGQRGEANQQTLVAVKGLAEGAQVIGGTMGSLRAGTQVRIAAPAPGNP